MWTGSGDKTGKNKDQHKSYEYETDSDIARQLVSQAG